MGVENGARGGGRHIRHTDYYYCRLTGGMVRVTLEHTLPPGWGDSARKPVATRLISCSGSVACGWRDRNVFGPGACPYRIEYAVFNH